MCDANILQYYWINEKKNCSDIISKHLNYPQLWHSLKLILFLSGNTGHLIVDDEEENKDECQVSLSLPVKCNQGKPY